jgi:hypothetical protein
MKINHHNSPDDKGSVGGGAILDASEGGFMARSSQAQCCNRIHALADYTVERTHRGWYFARTSRFGDMHAMKGPYSSERSVALMIARELLNEIIKRDAQTKLPG